MRTEKHQSRLPGELQGVPQAGVGVWVSVRNGLDMSDAALEQGDGAVQPCVLCITLGSVSGI